jgi:Tfp pilus assembly protein PilX
MIRMRSQRGATLLVALIMLVLLTLFAISALNTTTTNLKAVGNMQARTEALNTAQQAVETVISSTDFTDPTYATTVKPVPGMCDNIPNTLCMDAAGNIITSTATTPAAYTIKIDPKPSCVKVEAIKTTDPRISDFSKKANRDCFTQQQQQHGVAGAVTADSLCADSVWEITAESVAAVSGAKATVTQGIGIRISTDVMATSCT